MNPTTHPWLDEINARLGPKPRTLPPELQRFPSSSPVSDYQHWLTHAKKDRAVHMAHGDVVLGWIVDAVERRPEAAGGATVAWVLYSRNSAFSLDTDNYLYAWSSLLDAEGPQEKQIPAVTTLRHTASRNVMAIRPQRLPLALTRGAIVWTSATLVHAQHLPDGVLSAELAPMVVSPRGDAPPWLLPWELWPDDLVRYWRRRAEPRGD